MIDRNVEKLRGLLRAAIKDIINKVKKRQVYFESEDYLQGIVDDLICEIKEIHSAG